MPDAVIENISSPAGSKRKRKFGQTGSKIKPSNSAVRKKYQNADCLAVAEASSFEY